MAFDHKAFLPTLPHLPGVYRMVDGTGEVLYVGKARDLKNRLSSYFVGSGLSIRIATMVSQIVDIEITITRSEAEALLLENNLIKSLSPKYNVLFRDDKTYPYLIFSDDDFPRIAFFRGKPTTTRFFGPYPGSMAIRETILLLQKVFRLRTCENTVYAHRTRPCLLYQIARCSGPCVGLIDSSAYREDVEAAVALLQGRQDDLICEIEKKMQAASDALAFEQAAVFRDQIVAIVAIREKQYVTSEIDSNADVIALAEDQGRYAINVVVIRGGRHIGDQTFLPKNASGASAAEVLEAFISQHYTDETMAPVVVVANKAGIDTGATSAMLSAQAKRSVKVVKAVRSCRKAWFDMALKNAEHALKRQQSDEERQRSRLTALADALDLPQNLSRIECFDISHTMGEETMGSCVVFEGSAMQKKDYRRYKIREASPGDDYAAMAEVVRRRYSRLNVEEARLPDLILIDGGLGQVTIAATVLAELGLDAIPVVGVGKGPARQAGHEDLVFPDDREPIHLGPSHPGILLINEIRDEAHRFALTGHRGRRDRKRIGSVLDEIDDIGPKRRQRLLARFGGLYGIRGASVDDLATVEGISRRLAEKIYAHLHRT